MTGAFAHAPMRSSTGLSPMPRSMKEMMCGCTSGGYAGQEVG